jgi:hypothetical protein
MSLLIVRNLELNNETWEATIGWMCDSNDWIRNTYRMLVEDIIENGVLEGREWDIRVTLL